MKLADEFGCNLKEAEDYAVKRIMEALGVGKNNARKLLAECLIRNCVMYEIIDEALWLAGREDEVLEKEKEV